MHFACRSNGDITPPFDGARNRHHRPSLSTRGRAIVNMPTSGTAFGGPCCACIIVEKAALFTSTRLARNKQMRVSPTPKYNNIHFSPRILQHAKSLRTEPWILVQEQGGQQLENRQGGPRGAPHSTFYTAPLLSMIVCGPRWRAQCVCALASLLVWNEGSASLAMCVLRRQRNPCYCRGRLCARQQIHSVGISDPRAICKRDAWVGANHARHGCLVATKVLLAQETLTRCS
jgi:hypothetical protein